MKSSMSLNMRTTIITKKNMSTILFHFTHEIKIVQYHIITWTSIRILTTVIVKLYFTRKISFPFNWSYIEHSFPTTFYLLLILTLSRNDYVIIIINFILSRTLILAASSIMRRMLIRSQSHMLIASLYHYRLISTSGNLLIYMQEAQSIGNSNTLFPFVL